MTAKQANRAAIGIIAASLVLAAGIGLMAWVALDWLTQFVVFDRGSW